jgi:signal transduction histidine kinase/CheY-like chemotaxis protein
MRLPQEISTINNIRLRLSSIAGLMLLFLLFTVYIGGRYIVVQMTRQAEAHMLTVGDDITRLVHAELGRLCHLTQRLAESVVTETDSRLADNLRYVCFVSDVDATPVHLALFVAEDGRLIKGYVRTEGHEPDEVDVEAFHPCLAPDSALLTGLRNGRPVHGTIFYRGSLYFVSSTPVLTPESRVRGFLMLGSHIQDTAFFKQVTHQVSGSLASRASVALGWLICFIAAVGIVFVIPIFWVHSKLILDPLDILAQQIHEMRISRMGDEQGAMASWDVTQARCERESRGHAEAHLAKVQKMESLGTMAVGIAHDFNNILAIIRNTVELAGRQSGDEIDEAVRTICQATEKGATLTRQLMTYAGHSPAEFKCRDVNEGIRGLESLMNGVVAQNVVLVFKLGPNLPPVAIDPHQFWKVIINLLRNASEAFNGASGRITVSTRPLTLTRQISADFFSARPLPLERGVLIQIEDTGPGIHPDVIDRIFEPFVSTKAVGRGLGLATVFGIVGVHNGGIAIRSTLGKGTCFRIWLPVFKQPQFVPGAADTQSDAASGPLAAIVPCANPDGSAVRPLVLLVEDDPAILRTTSVVLRSLGIETLAASSQREAQTLFSRHADAIRLLLLDAQVGSFDNVRLLSTLRLSRPDLPAVILSGHAEGRVRTMFASVRYDAFLGKPYTRDELKAVLQNFITLS